MIQKILGAVTFVCGGVMLVLSGIVKGSQMQIFFLVAGLVLIYFGLKQLTYI